MTGLGLPPAAYATLRSVLERAGVDGFGPVDPRRLVEWLDRNAAMVDEVPQLVPQIAPRWTVKQAADAWGVSDRMARRRCAAGKVAGATRQRAGNGRSWLMPVGAVPQREDVAE